MGASSTVSNYTFKGISWSAGPQTGHVLDSSLTYTFFLNISSIEGNLVNCKIELHNLSLSTVASGIGGAIGSGTGCYASVDFSAGENDKLFGYYYIDLGEGYGLLKANDPWIFELNYSTEKTYGLFYVLTDFNDLPDWGSSHNRREFSKIVSYFFIMAILIAAFTVSTGYDFAQPGGAVILLWGFVAMGSFAGIFNIQGISTFTFINKYMIFMICSFMTWGFILGTWARTTT